MKKTLLLFFFLSSTFLFSQNLVINEVMSSNNNTIYDDDGDASDWIELFNGTSNQINLNGYYLSDDTSNTLKWKFGNAVIDPGKYLIIFASDKDTYLNYWHTNFKISSSGSIYKGEEEILIRCFLIR